MANKLTTKNGMLWIQPDGPNTAVYPLGCHDLGDLAESTGGIELLRCFKPDRSGWDVVGQTETPPDPVSFSVDFMVEKARDRLEKVTCPFAMYVTMSDCGRVDEFSNYVRGQIMTNVRRASRSYSNLVHHEEQNPATASVELEAWELLDIDDLSVARMTTALTQAWNDIAPSVDLRCSGDCGDQVDPGELAVVGSDALGGATADVPLTADEGVTWAAAAADPFGIAFNVMAVARVNVGRTTTRLIAGREGTGATQGQVAYSDDNGATWTAVSIGGAAVGHGVTYGQGIHVYDRWNIWLASADGYIYKSTDAGASWTAVESGVIHAADNHVIHFADDTYGICGGAAGVISVSSDGGLSWSAGGVPAASPVRGVWRFDRNNCWCCLTNGTLWYSTNGGATWTQRTGGGLPTAVAMRGMWWANRYQGFLIHNSAVPVGTIYHTNNGGSTWEALTTPTNTGLNSIRGVSPSLVYATGEVSTTSVILKVTRSTVS